MGHTNGQGGPTNPASNPGYVCKDDEPNGNTYCNNLRRYGGCDDEDNGWYFTKYCPRTCRKCQNGGNANQNNGSNGGKNNGSNNGKGDNNNEVTNTNGSQSSCKDIAKNCKEANAKPNDPRTCVGPRQNIYAIYCKKYHGFCGKQKPPSSTKERKCENTGNCGWYSRFQHGGCRSTYFKDNCRKFCNLC